MFRTVTTAWQRLRAGPPPPPPLDAEGERRAAAFARKLEVLNDDPYLMIADGPLRIISIFDDLKYDRADMDMISGPMRTRLLGKLEPLGFKQVSGLVIESAEEDVRVHFPKFRALGASPFDAMRDMLRPPQDYAALTPTQAACQMVDHYPVQDAVPRIKTLIQRQPINLLRLMDFLEHTDRQHPFLQAIGHLKYIQRQAVESEPLRSRRALR